MCCSMAASISRAAITARAAAFGSSNGAPNSAKSRRRETCSRATIAVDDVDQYGECGIESVHHLLRRPRTRGGGKAANVDEHDGYAPGISGGRWDRREQTPTTCGDTCCPQRPPLIPGA